VGDMVWLHLSKKHIHGQGKKIKPIRYGPFEIVQQVAENVFPLELPTHMITYYVINVENLKLYKPSMLDEGVDELLVLPKMDDLVPYV
jgi:hypothetical protein